jgi:hypothetical protein
MTEDFGIQEFKAFNSECGINQLRISDLKTLNPEPRTFDPDPPKSI